VEKMRPEGGFLGCGWGTPGGPRGGARGRPAGANKEQRGRNEGGGGAAPCPPADRANVAAHRHAKPSVWAARVRKPAKSTLPMRHLLAEGGAIGKAIVGFGRPILFGLPLSGTGFAPPPGFLSSTRATSACVVTPPHMREVRRDETRHGRIEVGGRTDDA